MMELPFKLPPISDSIPIWNGHGFTLNNNPINVLEYSFNSLGWNDDLTFFHEESAGDQHFIDCASRDHAISQLQSAHLSAQSTILEVGCSSGFMLERLCTVFSDCCIMGSDVVIEPLQKLSQKIPKIPLFRFDITQCPFPDQSIDAVIMLNVLEHIKADKTALQQVYRILKPGGTLVIEVPANPKLYDCYDKMLMHYRRYRAKDLRALALSVGFNIKKQSHLGFFLYPGFWLVKKYNQRFNQASESSQKKQIEKNINATKRNPLLHLLMQTELKLGNFISYPVGIRCLLTLYKDKKK